MKFAALAGLLSAAVADEKFLLDLNKEVINFSSSSSDVWTAEKAKATVKTALGEGRCQPIVDYMAWDLKPLDSLKQIETIYGTNYNHGVFGVKLCELEFESMDFKTFKDGDTTYTNPNTKSSITNAGNAYWANISSKDGDDIL